jgi:hypothetical protein
MTMFEVPKMASHPLDKYRQANIDYVSSSQISVSGNIIIGGAITTGGGTYVVYDDIVVKTLTGSVRISGSTVMASTLSANRISSPYISGSTTLSGATIFGNTITASTSLSGASYLGTVVTNVLASGATAPGVNTVTFTGSTHIVVTQSGNIITISYV